MSTLKANTISPIGSTLTLGAPVAGLSVADGHDTYANTTTEFYYTIWDNSTDSTDYNLIADVSFIVVG